MDDRVEHQDKSVKIPSNRSFGAVFTVFFLVLSLLPLIKGGAVNPWLLGISLAFGITALVIPRILAPFNRLWMKFGLLLHAIVSPVILGILFFLVITPMGLLMRLFGKDLLSLKKAPDQNSYWIERTPPGPDAESLKNQF